MPSNGDASASGKSKAEENFYLSEGKKNKKWKSSDVPSSSCRIDWDKTFKDAFVTDVEVADLKS
jgi:hypothetical protein